MEPKSLKPKVLAVSNVDSFFASGPGDGEEERALESHLLRQLIAEFRQLRLEVAELKPKEVPVVQAAEKARTYRY